MKNPLANRYAMRAIIFAMATFAFIACGDDSGSNASDQISESTDNDLVIKTFDDLPVCSDKRKGVTAYVKDEKAAYVCKDGDWTPDDSEAAETTKKTSSSSKKAQSSSSNKGKTNSSSSGKVASSSSFKYEQDSSAYVQPKVVAIKNKSISGVSQKGPFVTGSTVKLYELDGKSFAQTGKSFTGKTTSDDGKFSISSVSLASQYALLEATGYFRNEVTGEKSKGTITLNAITDLSDRKNVNINLLTHLEYERVMHLIESGINFKAAKKQAEAEILNAFGVKGEFANFEDLSIFGKGDGNAALLAFSMLMLEEDDSGSYKTLSEAELTECLMKFATDIATDGFWDDEKTKAVIADWAAMKDKAYESDYNGFSDIRQGIEKWNLGIVPDFEKYVHNFWVAIYGLGKCDSKNSGEVIVAKNEYSMTYNSWYHFICKNGAWRFASDLEKDTYQWKAGKDGEIRAGDVTTQNYDYDGKLKKWRYATWEEAALGGCTEVREKDIRRVNGWGWCICQNREWKQIDSIIVDTQGWSKGDDGKLRKGDSTAAVYKYDEAEKKWLRATKNDTMLKLDGCTINRRNEINKSSVDDKFYVCDSTFYTALFSLDTVKTDWREATYKESVLGVCTEARGKDFSINTGKVNGDWYICKNGEWMWLSSKNITVDTLGWSKGIDGELRKGNKTDALYKYDEAKKEWLSADYFDETLKLNGCTTNRNGEIGKSPLDSVYYICYLNGLYQWREALVDEYNTYGEKCTTTEVGKRIDGKVFKAIEYYCTVDGWVYMKDWSWGIPKEFRFNPNIAYDSIIDSRDKKVYKTVTIGNQVWMAENLNYYDASLDGHSWCYGATSSATTANCAVAGRLYTWAAAIDSVALATDKNNPQDCGYGKTCAFSTKIQGICPNGWHLPNKDEWETLIPKATSPGGSNVDNKLKSQTGWIERNSWSERNYGTDNYGFSALPAGFRNSNGDYKNEGSATYFWSSTENNSSTALYWYLEKTNRTTRRTTSNDKNNGFSIRCIKD